MAKVTGPLMSLDASGTVGKTAVFSKWKGRNYVRLRVTPQNPKSDAQAIARQAIGAIGKALSFVLWPNSFNGNTESPFYTSAKANAPAGQSWISYVLKSILGTGLSTWSSNRSAYDGLQSGDKTAYGTAGSSLGLASFNLPYGELDAVTAGEAMYHLAFFAVNNLGFVFEEEGSTLAEPDPADLAALVAYIKEVEA